MKQIGTMRVAAVAAALALSFGAAHAADLTVVNFGGAMGDAGLWRIGSRGDVTEEGRGVHPH